MFLYDSVKAFAAILAAAVGCRAGILFGGRRERECSVLLPAAAKAGVCIAGVGFLLGLDGAVSADGLVGLSGADVGFGGRFSAEGLPVPAAAERVMDAGIFPGMLVRMGAGADRDDCRVGGGSDSDAAQECTAGRMAAGSVSGVHAVRGVSELCDHFADLIFCFFAV